MKRWSPVPAVSDRDFWQKIAATDYGKYIIERAEAELDTPVRCPEESVYRASFVTKERRPYELQHNALIRLYNIYAVATLCDPRKEFVEKLCSVLDVFANQLKTWIWPAHDQEPHVDEIMANIDHKEVTMDLRSLEIGSSASVLLHTLGDIIPAPLHAALKKELFRQIIDPLLAAAKGTGKINHWMEVTHNWNAVCFGYGVTAMLAADVPESDRDIFLDFALEKNKLFFKGFTDDGYCQEGPLYYNYGFGHFLMMALGLYRASNKTMNLVADPKLTKILAYPERMMLSDKLFPAFADCVMQAPVRKDLLGIRDYLLGRTPVLTSLPQPDRVLFEQLMIIGATDFSGCSVGKIAAFDCFEKTGVFICRSEKLTLAMKGGFNQEFHNHNDVGSYVLTIGKEPALVDPGAAVYRMDSFLNGGIRYANRLRSSYGHAVPVIDGNLQIPGHGTDAVVLNYTERSAELDITAAYRCEKLQQVTRQMKFAPNESVTICDTAKFSAPATFAVPLITFAKWQEVAPGVLELTRIPDEKIDYRASFGNWRSKDNDFTPLPWKLRVEITANGKYTISDELIDDDIQYPEPVRRILISFREEQQEFKLAFKFSTL